MLNKLPRPRMGLAAGLASVVVAGAALAGCNSSSPLVFLSGNPSNAGIAAQDVHPGQSVSYAAFLASRPGGYSYRITRARLIPLPGYRTPHLLGAVFLRSRAVPIQADGYPPLQGNGTRYPVRAMAGYTARSGSEPYQPQLVLMYGVRGDGLGAYAVAGIEITYLIGQRTYTANIYDGALLFYYPRHETRAERQRDWARYEKLNRQTTAALRKLIG